MKSVVFFFIPIVIGMIFCSNSIFATEHKVISYNPDSLKTIVGDTSQIRIYKTTAYPNGNKKDEGYVVNGERDGTWIFYDLNGFLSSQMEYKMGILEGNGCYYFPNGIVKQELNYIANKKDGVARSYYESGALMSTKTYANDKLNGLCCNYFLNGNIKECRTYIADSLTGNFIEYFDEGQIKMEGIYLNGIYDGTIISYHRNGCVAFKKIYSNGLQNDSTKSYYDDGTLASEYKLKDGEIVGTYKMYHTNGFIKVKADRYTRNDSIVETIMEYNDSGQFSKVIVELTIKNEKIKKFSSHFANGNPEIEKTFYDNYPTGTWNFYYDNGQLEHSETYASKQIIETWTFKDKLNYGNQLHGTCQVYYDNGKLKDQATFNHGVLHGEKIFCDSVSKMKEVMRFEYGIQQGYTDLYDSTGILSVSGFYQYGKLMHATYFYRDHTVQSTVTFENDIPDGPCKSYYVGGQLECTGYMTRGKMSGQWICYYRNGVMSEIGNYNYWGYKVGKWKYYDDKGKLQLKEKY